MVSSVLPSFFPSPPASLLFVSLLFLVLVSPVLSSLAFPPIPWILPMLPVTPPRINDNRSTCLSPTQPPYQLAPNPRLQLSVVQSSGNSLFYFWPCGVVTSTDCVSHLGYLSQLCEVRTVSYKGVINLIPFEPRDGSYDSSLYSFSSPRGRRSGPAHAVRRRVRDAQQPALRRDPPLPL